MIAEAAREGAMQEKLREALQACIDSGLGSHDHWDDTMQHGKGCLRCIKQHEARELARAALAASEPAPQPVKGEEAWLDEFVTAAISGTSLNAEKGFLRNCLRTCLRAFAVNYKRQLSGPQPLTKSNES